MAKITPNIVNFVKKQSKKAFKRSARRQTFKGTPSANDENENKRKTKEKIHKMKRDVLKEPCQKKYLVKKVKKKEEIRKRKNKKVLFS